MSGEISSLELTDEQSDVINEFIRKCPITSKDVNLHQSSMNAKHVKRSTKNSHPPQRLVPPLPSVSSTMTAFRTSLPTFHYRSDILSSIETHNVTLITGGTGCGKTTQVPQFVLEKAHSDNRPVRIFCTQPRRLSTIAISKRVAQERGEALGTTVGYHIRLEQKISSETTLIYCTSGVLLRILTADDTASDITHIILDEVHEREQNTDYLLIALKQALKKRKDLTVILMSATMEGNLELFRNYFEMPTAHINIPSKLYHVEKFDLADVLAMTDFFAKLPKANNMNDRFTSSVAHRFERSVVIGEFPPKDDENGSETRKSPISVPERHSSSGSSQRDLSPDLFGETSMGKFGSFGFQQGRRSKLEEALKHLNRVLPNRPQFFDPCFITGLRRAHVRRDPLLDLYLQTYMNVGGCKFSELVDIELVCRLVIYLMDSPIKGAILVFLPGYDDIIATNDRLICLLRNETTIKPSIFMLHSQINPSDQQLVFGSVPPNHRKVILSTNIAEASVTIDDVVFVIDSGKVKEKSYDHFTRISQLRMQWIAKSNAEQRCGRAGRCRNGYCFRLYSEDDYKSLLDTQIPEMRRSAIHDVCLHAKIFAPDNMSVRKFLQMAPEPPLPDAVKQSLEFLEQLGALHMPKREPVKSGTFMAKCMANRSNVFFVEPDLTYLGRAMAFLPIDPQLTRLLIFGVILQCLDPIITLVAALSYRDPFVLPMDDEERNNALGVRDEFAGYDLSDHLMLIRAINAYTLCENHKRDFCSENFLSTPTMKLIYGIRKQLIIELRRQNLLPTGVYTHDHPKVNRYRDCWPMIQAAIVAGCYPGIGVVKDGDRLRKIRIDAGQAQLHPSSVLRRQLARRSRLPTASEGDLQRRSFATPSIEFIAYQEISRINHRILLKTTTIVPPLTVFLFAGPLKITKEQVERFEIVYNEEEEEYDDDEEEDSSKSYEGSSELSSAETDYSTTSIEAMHFDVELDPFLIFQMPYRTAQTTMRLRFKLVSYVLHMLRNPFQNLNKPNNELLDCLASVLTLEHQYKSFNICEDL